MTDGSRYAAEMASSTGEATQRSALLVTRYPDILNSRTKGRWEGEKRGKVRILTQCCGAESALATRSIDQRNAATVCIQMNECMIIGDRPRVVNMPSFLCGLFECEQTGVPNCENL